MNTYEDFINQEKKNNYFFLTNFQILDNRFDEDEYSLIKLLWSNQHLINCIYSVIDDIIKKTNPSSELRFLIISDFLFSLNSNNLQIPSEIILKISRNEYLNRIRFRAKINYHLFEYNYYDYICIHQKLLIGLRLNGVLERTTMKILDKKKWGTVVYFKLNFKKDFLYTNNLFIINKYPFVLICINKTYYSAGSFRNIIKSKRKKREMEDMEICYNSIKKANQISFILDSKLYNINKIYIDKEKYELLDIVQCLNLSEYFLKIQKKIDNNRMDLEYHNLIIQFQKISSLQVLNEKIFDQIFYLPCFADNRGRQYYFSLISPTFHILFRYFYVFYIKKKIENLENSKFYKKIIKYKDLIIEFNLDNEKSYLLIVLFIEIGKFFVKSENDHIIKTSKIILLGKQNYQIHNVDIDLKNLLYIKKIYFILDNIIDNNIIDNNTIIFKDATASGLQNYGILLGYKIEKLQYLNINSENDDYCDTYKYLITRFLLNVKDIYKKRKYWKSTIMTIPYNAVWFTCFNKFIKKIIEDNIDYNSMTEDEKEIIRKMHKKFYNDIKHNIKEEFYENKKGQLIEFKYNKWLPVSITEYKINYKNARDKYTNTLYMLNYDEDTTNKASEANNMHRLDALLVKEILKKFEILTIHDDFGIRLCELHLVIDEINEYYSKIIGIETYSIHIII